MIKDDEKQQEQEQQEENYEEEEEEESSSQFLSILCRFLTESSTSKQKGRGGRDLLFDPPMKPLNCNAKSLPSEGRNFVVRS